VFGGNGGCGPAGGIGGLGDGGNGGFGSSMRSLLNLSLCCLGVSQLLSANCDSNLVKVATNGQLTIGTGNQDDAVALAPDGNVTATAFDVSELTVSRHRS
jgi:hypothetical protein